MRAGRAQRICFFLLIALAVTGCDQAAKWQVLASLTSTFDAAAGDGGRELDSGDKLARFLDTRHPRSKQPIEVIGGLWHLRYIENPGAAWSLLRDAPAGVRVPLLLAASGAAMILLLILLRRTRPEQTRLRLALALIIGGALGNFLDRVRLGYVIDFVHWHWYDRLSWPIFNIADVALSAGIALLLIAALRERSRGSPAPPSTMAGTWI